MDYPESPNKVSHHIRILEARQIKTANKILHYDDVFIIH